MTTAVFILQLAMAAGIAAYIYYTQQNVFRVDIQRCADTYALTLLSDYAADLGILEMATTKQYVRSKYVQDCALYGLPVAAADRVANLVWQRIAKATSQTEIKTAKFEGFYD